MLHPLSRRPLQLFQILQILAPPVPLPPSDFLDSDLFGTVEQVQPPRPFSYKEENPFDDQCDPFLELWAEDKEPHFW